MRPRHIPTLLLMSSAFIAIAACSKSEPEQGLEAQLDITQEKADGPVSGVDYHSFANTADYRVRHLDLDLTVDFSRKVLDGEAILHFDRVSDGNPPLVLDTRDIVVESVRAGSGDDLQATSFTLVESDDFLGEPLTIELPDHATIVAIRYRTVRVLPACSGWIRFKPRANSTPSCSRRHRPFTRAALCPCRTRPAFE